MLLINVQFSCVDLGLFSQGVTKLEIRLLYYCLGSLSVIKSVYWSEYFVEKLLTVSQERKLQDNFK